MPPKKNVEQEDKFGISSLQGLTTAYRIPLVNQSLELRYGPNVVSIVL
uniref:Uncharacterized protein n=1 Tax=Arundo donax TaxID=35708 RepID=A0A0A9EW18_ARUDO